METEILFPGNKKGPNLNKLLSLIEEGDADEVLSQEDHRAGFNELLRFELVAVKGDRIYLTELGRQAKAIGVQQVIENIRANTKPVPVVLPVTQPKLIRKRSLYYYLLLLLALLLIFLYQVALT